MRDTLKFICIVYEYLSDLHLNCRTGGVVTIFFEPSFFALFRTVFIKNLSKYPLYKLIS